MRIVKALMQYSKTLGLLAGLFCLFVLPMTALAQTTDVVKGQVIDIVSQKTVNDPITDKDMQVQTLKVELVEGAKKGTAITVDNAYGELFNKGDFLYIRDTVYTGVSEHYEIEDSYRLGSLAFFLGLFILVVLLFGGLQGLRGLITLAGSFVLIIYVLLPQLFKGTSPTMLSIGVASLIIVLGSYVTHGFRKTTTAAVIGMLITISLVGTLAHYAVGVTKLNGFATEESVYLNVDTKGALDMQGLLLGGILIGLLGVLYDVAIGQAVAVEELYAVGGHLDKATIYKRALRIGREHIGALVNTLAIAYVGASLPLLLVLFYDNNQSHHLVINSEIFATEVIRILIGSIGVVIAVPITTFVAIHFLVKKKTS